jgi:glutathione peroxidase
MLTIIARVLGLAALVALFVPGSGSSRTGDEGGELPDLELQRIDGRPEQLAAYRGQVLLLVNVASRCGFTSQYEGLEALYERYQERGFSILAFPSNDFAGQEPGSNAEIAKFCRATYGVKFPLFSKLHVGGPDQHPLYAYLTALPDPLGGPVGWNFQKYLVDREGRVVQRLAPAVRPEDPALVARIEELLGPVGE